MSSARRRARHDRQRSQRDRRRGSFYTGGPTGTAGTTKQERTKQSKVADPASKRPFRLPLVVRPDGSWGYKFGKMRPLQKGR